MKLKIISTGSVGNCYVLQHGINYLVIDCGVKFEQLKKGVDFKLSQVSGVLISHQHGDHSRCVNDVINRNMPIYTSSLCAGGLGISNYRDLNIIEDFKIYKIGEFTVMPLPLNHDAPCQGFVIHHHSCGNIVFATDTTAFNYVIPNVSHWLIEANFCAEFVQEKIDNGIDEYLSDRTMRTHLSIQKCIKALLRNDLSKTETITLIHLSDRNSHADNFRNLAERSTGKRVYIAENGIEMDLSCQLK